MENTKLIRGVIYLEGDKENAEEEMLELLNEAPALMEEAEKRHIFDETQKHGIQKENAIANIATMNAIDAITRYDDKTDMTYNLIIPKESLSTNLVNELSKVDIAPTLMEKYSNIITENVKVYSNTLRKYQIPENENPYNGNEKISEDEEYTKTVNKELQDITSIFNKMGIPVTVRKLSDDEAKQFLNDMGIHDVFRF